MSLNILTLIYNPASQSPRLQLLMALIGQWVYGTKCDVDEAGVQQLQLRRFCEEFSEKRQLGVYTED